MILLEDLKEHAFYLIHVNYFCKTDHDEYLPAEIAISEFSLLNGVHKFFHRFLSPGRCFLIFAATFGS